MREMPNIPDNQLRFHLPIFEGPLDLLMHLIRDNEIDIYDIPIAEITRQYLEYLEHWESLDLALAGEYIVMAATLLEIKSRMLLPQAPPPEGDDDEQDPRAELVMRLLEYQRFQGAVETLQEWEAFRRKMFFRGALENPDDYLLPVEPGDLNALHLLEAFKRVLAAAGVQDENVSAVTPRRRVSLKMKMVELIRKIYACPEGISFEALFIAPYYLYDIVLTFLAMLELLKNERIRVSQNSPDEEIILYPIEEIRPTSEVVA